MQINYTIPNPNPNGWEDVKVEVDDNGIGDVKLKLSYHYERHDLASYYEDSICFEEEEYFITTVDGVVISVRNAMTGFELYDGIDFILIRDGYISQDVMTKFIMLHVKEEQTCDDVDREGFLRYIFGCSGWFG